MLSPIEKFLVSYGIRSADYLGIMKIHKTSDIVFPRNTLYHYLTMKNDVMFPNRNDYFYNGIVRNKKLKIAHKLDLTEKEGTTTYKNRYLPKDVREWFAQRRRAFRSEDLPAKRNIDNESIATINYNTIKDLYNYRSTAQSSWFYNRSILKTYLDGIKDALVKDPYSNHFITFELPDVIPGFSSVKKLLKYKPLELSRLLREPAHYFFLELYKWLSYKETPTTEDTDLTEEELLEIKEEGDLGRGLRTDSLMKDITDEDSKRIFVEIKYRGYVTYLPLSIMRGLSKDSLIPSSKSFPDIRTRRFFINFLMMIQDEIVKRIDLEDVSLITEDDTDEYLEEHYGDELDDLDEEEIEEDEVKNGHSNSTLVERMRARREEKRLKEEKLKEEKRSIEKDIEIESMEPDKFYDIEDIFKEPKTRTEETRGLFDIEIVDRLEKRQKSKIEHSLVPEEISEEDVDGEESGEETNSLLKSNPLSKEVKEKLLRDKPREESLEEFIEEGRIRGTLSPADIRSLRLAEDKRKRLLDPITGKTLEDLSTLKIEIPKLDEETVAIEIKTDLVAENLKTNKTKKYDELYIKEKLHADTMSLLADIEKSGFIITDIKTNEVKSSVDDYIIHQVTMKPFRGKTFTIPVRMPRLSTKGVYTVGGVKYRYRKTDQDVPIRKISPVRVALASNYGKFFISRSVLKAHSPERQLYEFVAKDYLNGANTIKKMTPGKKNLNHLKGLPNDYYTLASRLDSLETEDYTFVFNREEMEKTLKPEMIKAVDDSDNTFVGYTKQGEVLMMKPDGIIMNYITREDIGSFFDIFGIPVAKRARGFSVMKVLGEDIPLGPIMSYYLGLSNLVQLTETQYRVLPVTKRVKLEKDEFEIRFSDYRLVLNLDTEEKRILFQGFGVYKDFLKLYPLSEFDKKDIYLALLESRKAKLVHLKELDFLPTAFLDSITVDVLRDIGEPTEYLPLLLRANQLLEDNSHPDMGDPYYSRIRGYDRFPGLMYRAIMEEVRNHKVRNRANSKPTIDNYKVWNYITNDQSRATQVILNPIASIKEEEIVTLTGRDGLNSGAVSGQLRRFHEHDVGLMTEATVDSKDVAVTKYLTPYMKLKNVRGIVERNYDEVEENPTKIYSTPSQLKPMTEFDDQFRYKCDRSRLVVMLGTEAP